MTAYSSVQFIAGLFLAVLPCILTILKDISLTGIVVQTIFVLLTLGISVLAGAQF